MASMQERSNRDVVVSTVLGYIDDHRDKVSQWTSQKKQEQGLLEFLNSLEQPLVKSNNQGGPTEDPHTGVSLRIMLYGVVSKQKPNSSDSTVASLFSVGINVLKLQYLVQLGLRPNTAVTGRLTAQNNVDGHSAVSEHDNASLEGSVEEQKRPATRQQCRGKRGAAPPDDEDSPLSSSRPDPESLKPRHKKARLSSEPCSENEESRSDSESHSREQSLDSRQLSVTTSDKSQSGSESYSEDRSLDEQQPSIMNSDKSAGGCEAEAERNSLRTPPRVSASPIQGSDQIGIIPYKIAKALTIMDELVDQVVRFLAPSEATPMILYSNPDSALRAIYHKVFGSGSWIGNLTSLASTPSNTDLVKSLVTSWILTQVLEQPTPWKLDHAELVEPGSIGHHIEAFLKEESVQYRDIVARAAFQRISDPVFEAQQVSEHVRNLTDRFSMTFWPHISSLPVQQRSKSPWRSKVENVIKYCVQLKAKLEATPGLRYEWLWLESGEQIGEGMKVLYQRTDSSVVGLTITPGVMASKGRNELKCIKSADVVPSG